MVILEITVKSMESPAFCEVAVSQSGRRELHPRSLLQEALCSDSAAWIAQLNLKHIMIKVKVEV